ncbi:hypothetical protein ACFJIX_14185 [Roseateles sp. UC29_93]|uniref:hypothetical protein n=1 Tax=Roseateles sp. UC29_93 TaxID=3350177 RepID=UPI003672710F
MFDLDESDFRQAVHDLAGLWGHIAFPIIVPKHQPGAAESIGTGFVAEVKGQIVLVSSLHVMHQLQASKAHIAVIRGKSLHLSGLSARQSRVQDVAVIMTPPDWQAAHLPERVNVAQVGLRRPDMLSTGVFLCMGYPVTKNTLQAFHGKTQRHLHCLSLREAPPGRVVTTIPNALVLDYDPKKTLTTDGQPAGSPVRLHGMSGGPCFEVLLGQEVDGRPRLSLSIVGVINEWHPKNGRAIVVSRLSEVMPGAYEDTPVTEIA